MQNFPLIKYRQKGRRGAANKAIYDAHFTPSEIKAKLEELHKTEVIMLEAPETTSKPQTLQVDEMATPTTETAATGKETRQTKAHNKVMSAFVHTRAKKYRCG